MNGRMLPRKLSLVSTSMLFEQLLDYRRFEARLAGDVSRLGKLHRLRLQAAIFALEDELLSRNPAGYALHPRLLVQQPDRVESTLQAADRRSRTYRRNSERDDLSDG